jgi:predicted transcriptional regulator
MPARAENLSVRLNTEVKEQVDELARITRRSRSFIINEAVETYVRDQSAFVREVQAAVKSAQSGIGHSKEQVFSWLDSLAEGKKLPIPTPDIFPAK